MMGRSILWGTVLAAVSVSVAAQSSNVIGLPPQAVEHLPGAARLFEVRNASAPPRIVGVPGRDFVPGEVVARFPLELSDEEIELLAWLSGAHRVERLSPLGLFVIHGPPGVPALEKLMEKLWETGAAVSIDANYVGGLAFVPDDPHHVNGNQWYHEDSSDIDLDLRSAWDVTQGSPDVVVAVIDSGIRLAHPEFAGRLYVNPGEIPGNFIDDDGNGYVDDVSGWNGVDNNNDIYDATNGHGTWVASILLGNSNNNHQIAGFDHSARLLPLRALAGPTGLSSHLVACLDYLIVNPEIAKIANMSLAGYSESQPLEAALSAAAESSILIGGSGNDGPGNADVHYPESHPRVITVSGTDRSDNLAFFPSVNTTAATGNSVEFSAPAVDIYTASWADPNNPSAAQVGLGTSFSAPMVSGIASLGLAIRAGMTESDLVFALRESAVDLGAAGRDPEFGWGRVNAHGALVVLKDLIFFDGFETGDLTAWSSFLP